MSNRAHRRPTRTDDRNPLPGRPVSTAEARELGWTSAAQRHGVSRGDVLPARRGVLAPHRPVLPVPWWQAERDALWDAAEAAVVSSPRSVPSHAPAVVALGLPLLKVPARPCLTVPAGTALRRVVEAHLHRATLTPDDLVVVGRHCVTSPSRTVMDLARECGVDAGVVAADAALHAGLTDMVQLRTTFDQCRGWPGARRSGAVLLAADGRAESPLESLSRLRISSTGLPMPQSQVSIYDLDGRFLGRPDFYWDDFGVVGEADGELKYADDGESIRRERRRQRAFDQTGLLVVRWGYRDVHDFAPVARQLREAYLRGVRPGSQLRRWRAVTEPRPALHPPVSLIRSFGAS